MDVYLMQHGEAVADEADPQRPLSDVGRRSVAAVAGHVAAGGVRIDRIVHSGKLRAEQSAELLAEALECSDVRAVAGLAPKDSVQAAAAALIDPRDPPGPVDPAAARVDPRDPAARADPADPAAQVDLAIPTALAIVGHLPFLDRLASLLVVGDPDAHVIAFRNAALVRLVPADPAGLGRSAKANPASSAAANPPPSAALNPSSAPDRPSAQATRFAVAWILPPELTTAAPS